MRKFIPLLIVLMTVISAYSNLIKLPDDSLGKGRPKGGKIETLDTAKWEIIYIHTIRDTVANKTHTFPEMLTVGERYRWYGGYDTFRKDSMNRADSAYYASLSMNEYFALTADHKLVAESLIVDNQENVLTFYGYILMNNYSYQEPVPQIEWTLEDESTEIMGYECFKATAKWRGREWTAWYGDIPASYGPWKFNGLPGVILRLEDSLNVHNFEAIETREMAYPFGYKKRTYTKTNREKYNEGLKDYKENTAQRMADAGLSTPQKGIKRKLKKTAFCPIELE